MYYQVRQRNKYGARQTVFDGRKYDSKGEAGLAQDIELLRRSGAVIKVEPQKTFDLYGRNGSRVCRHRVDFLLTFKDGHREAWEYKGYATDVWRIKRDLFVDNYPDILYVVWTARETKYYGGRKKTL